MKFLAEEEILTEEEMREILVKEIILFESQQSFADKYNLARASISSEKCGRRPVSKLTAKVLGYEQIIVYRKI